VHNLASQERHVLPAAVRLPLPEGWIARAASEDIRISPMVRLELQYLHEIGRVSEPAVGVVDALHVALGLTVCNAAFAAVVREAESNRWTRDPFDRLIVGQAALQEAPLITKDATVHANYPAAVW
jgi:PIN domain nuclease of toxin-antitoxin system